MKIDIDSSLSGQVNNASEGLFFNTASAFQVKIKSLIRQAFYSLVNEEIEQLCGAAWQRGEKRNCYRYGSAPSSVYINGERQALNRPRVRSKSSDKDVEIELNTWKMAQDPQEWEESIMRAILAGVSTRKISQLNPSNIIGMSRSRLSSLWQRKAKDLVDQMQDSDLTDFDLLILMLDAVVLSKDIVATVALGIDVDGNKRILGFKIGSSENKEVCLDLLNKLKSRGLSVSEKRDLFAVLDGSKALKNALLEVFPQTHIQRCLVHKERNIKGYLSKKYWAELARLFNRLRKAQGIEDALEACRRIEEFLKTKNAQARESFQEAGDELLALFRLNVPNTLNVSLLSTNSIENSFKNLRRHIGRVCRWRKETDQASLWIASGLILAEKGFKKIKGHNDLPALAEALKNDQTKSKQAA